MHSRSGEATVLVDLHPAPVQEGGGVDDPRRPKALMGLRRMSRRFLVRIVSAAAALTAVLAGAEARAGERAAADSCGTANLLAGMLPKEQAEVRGNAALVTDGAIVPEGA